MEESVRKFTPKPPWLKIKLPSGDKYHYIRTTSQNLNLATVCQEAMCPNIGECWSSGTATFMILGRVCTRACRFCAVKTAKKPAPLEKSEPLNLATTLKVLDLKYVVITTVDRDDLPDQGSEHISLCIKTVQEHNPNLLVEILMPDFRGEEDLIREVALSKPSVIAHNIETVERLTKRVRDKRAGYKQSLHVLSYVKNNFPLIYTKSSIMVGLGESKDEVLKAMQDLRDIDVDFLTIGQYLRPNLSLLPVEEYVEPKVFEFYEKTALNMGFKYVASGPLVRSSYKAGEYFISSIIKKRNPA